MLSVGAMIYILLCLVVFSSYLIAPLHPSTKTAREETRGKRHLRRTFSADRLSDPMLSLAAAASGYVLNAPAPMAARARAVSMDAAKMECAAAAASNSLPASHSCAEPALSAAP